VGDVRRVTHQMQGGGEGVGVDEFSGEEGGGVEEEEQEEEEEQAAEEEGVEEGGGVGDAAGDDGVARFVFPLARVKKIMRIDAGEV